MPLGAYGFDSRPQYHLILNINPNYKMIATRTFSLIIFMLGATLFAVLGVTAQVPATCQPPVLAAGVYNFVPDPQLQTGDFRALLKTETAFIQKLRDSEILDVTDLTTQIPPAEIQPEPPPITGDLDPTPAQIPEPYFFTGQITKASDGILLTVQLRRSADSSTLTEVKTPFSNAGGSEAAGNTNAAAMLAFFATQAQTARDDRETSDHAIDPHIELIIDKLQLKPNETSPVKIILSDCDGVRLKHRTIEAFLQLSRGSTPVQENTLVRVTDDKGERNGDIGAKSPGVITYIAKFKYKDVMGVQRERTDTKTIVISGGEAHIWQMRVDALYEKSTLYFSTDSQSGRWSGRRYLIRKKASMVFVFKADDTDGSGEVATDQYKTYNGFGEVYLRDKSVDAQESSELRVGSGLLDQRQEAAERLTAGFSINPANNEFQVSLQNIGFVGTSELFALKLHPRNYVHKTGLEFAESLDAGGGGPITPQMKKSGVYTFRKYDRTVIDDPENSSLRRGGTKGYELTKYDFEVRRISPSGTGIITR